MAAYQPPRKKRKLSQINNCPRSINNYHHRHTNGIKHHNHNRNYKNGAKIAKIEDLMRLIENEPDENIEIDVLTELIKIILAQIKLHKFEYDLYVKLSWCYLRSGQYDEGICYFNEILPIRSHEKFYTITPTQTPIPPRSESVDKCPINHHNVIKNGEEINSESDEDSDLEKYLKAKKKKFKLRKKRKLKKRRLEKLKKNIESKKRPKLKHRNRKHSKSKPTLTSESESESSDTEIIKERLNLIPIEFEISIRVNIALMLCRICDYEEALRHTYIMRDLYLKQYENEQDLSIEHMKYDPYIDYIEVLIMYSQKYWHQTIERALIIIKHQEIIKKHQTKQKNKNKNKKFKKKEKYKKLICKLDGHSLFELYCILGDSYSRIDELEEAEEIFEDIILPHIITKKQKLDLSLKYHWIYEIYLRYLLNKRDIKRGYNLCMKLMSYHISYRYNESIRKLCESFNLYYHHKDDNNNINLYHFIVDAEYFGNQCRFVNHSEDDKLVNCIFTARYRYGNTSHPSQMEVWLKSIKKIDKNTELLVNYGSKYWENIKSCPRLKKREKWDEQFIFTHLCLDELSSFCETKELIKRHHFENEQLADKTYPKSIEIKRDKYNGFGCFSTMTIKKDQYILRYAGIRKLVTNHDQSKSRYAIELKNDLNK